MLDIIIVIACLYFAYSNARMLLEIPFAQWELVQYLLALVTLALVVVGLWKAYRAITAFINAQKRAQSEAEKIRAEAGLEKAAQEEEPSEDEAEEPDDE